MFFFTEAMEVLAVLEMLETMLENLPLTPPIDDGDGDGDGDATGVTTDLSSGSTGLAGTMEANDKTGGIYWPEELIEPLLLGIPDGTFGQ
jgi:hypothetical protein